MLGAVRRARGRRRVRAAFACAGPLPELLVRPGAPPEPLPPEAARYETTHVLVGSAVDVAPLARALAAAPEAAVVTCDAVTADGLPVLRPGSSPVRDAVVDPTAGACLVRRDLAEDPWAAVLEHGRVHVPLPVGRLHDVPARKPATTPPLTHPTVEVIVPFRDRPDLLRRCLAALDRTTYERLTVTLVDNGSTEPELAPLLAGRNVRHDPRPFNFSALNNAAAAASPADVIVFLNNDTEVSPGWLEPLLAYALRPDVGAVAPLLLRSDGKVQHAGVAVGMHGTAGHPFAGLWPDTPTAFGTAAEPRNWLAVSAACLAIERAKFPGFDESFVIAGQDVDLGLRLHAAGLRNVCTPESIVVHDESATRAPLGHLDADVRLSRERYEPFLSGGDPYYHPALTLERTDLSFRT